MIITSVMYIFVYCTYYAIYNGTTILYDMWKLFYKSSNNNKLLLRLHDVIILSNVLEFRTLRNSKWRHETLWRNFSTPRNSTWNTMEEKPRAEHPLIPEVKTLFDFRKLEYLIMNIFFFYIGGCQYNLLYQLYMIYLKERPPMYFTQGSSPTPLG